LIVDFQETVILIRFCLGKIIILYLPIKLRSFLFISLHKNCAVKNKTSFINENSKYQIVLYIAVTRRKFIKNSLFECELSCREEKLKYMTMAYFGFLKYLSRS